MKSHSSTNSSTSSWLSFTTREKRTIHYHSSLHSVRKTTQPAAKLTKKPIAPIPPPRVYSVDPLQFKQVVQMLTAAPEFQSESSTPPQRLQKLAPPPLALNQITVLPPQPQQSDDHHVINHPLSNVKKIKATSIWNTCSAAAETLESTKNSPSGWFGLLSPLSNGWSGLLSPLSNGWSGLLSPLSNGWSSFPVLSPGTISAFGMNTSTTSFSLQVFPDF